MAEKTTKTLLIDSQDVLFQNRDSMHLEEFASNIFDYKPQMTRNVEQLLMEKCQVFDPTLIVVLNEALVNAATHGNHQAADKHFRFYYELRDKQYFRFIIEDEGDGFSVGDVNAFLENKESRLKEYKEDDLDLPPEALQFLMLHEVTNEKTGHTNAGLGITMMLEHLDRVVYNEHGNALAGEIIIGDY